MSVVLEERATEENFDEAAYLAANPDVAEAVRKGACRSGRHHFEVFGRKEGRRLRRTRSIEAIQQKKIRRIEPLLKLDMAHTRRGEKYDFLTDDVRRQANIVDTDAVSSHDYNGLALAWIEELRDGLLLDCGAGKRPIYYPNVVNYEVVDYDSTDVLGIGEVLPFNDESFDAVISLSVLEHIRDPFACAAEIARVLKPGGRLLCSVPFLQPLHGYPHHYYNMTGQGLRALFEDCLQIDHQEVGAPLGPVHALNWIVQSWADGLKGKARDEFLSLRLRDLLGNSVDFYGSRWVRELSREKNFELASATLLVAHKRPN